MVEEQWAVGLPVVTAAGDKAVDQDDRLGMGLTGLAPANCWFPVGVGERAGNRVDEEVVGHVQRCAVPRRLSRWTTAHRLRSGQGEDGGGEASVEGPHGGSLCPGMVCR